MASAESAPAFETEFLSRTVPSDPRIAELIVWCRRFAELGLTPAYGRGAQELFSASPKLRRSGGERMVRLPHQVAASAHHGNVSVRTADGCLISGTQTDKSVMRPEQFVEVVGVEQTPCCVRLRCRGIAFPSSDALIHAEIYRWRPDVQAILHGHGAAVLAAAGRLRVPSTDRDYPSGSRALAQALEPLVRRHDFVVVAQHGFIALGASVDAAGRLAETWHRNAV